MPFARLLKKKPSLTVAHCSIEEIEELNILHASIKAMHKAIAGLAKTPAFIAVDGNRFHPYKNPTSMRD